MSEDNGQVATENQPTASARLTLVLEWMEKQGIQYGSQYAIEDLERVMMHKRDTAKFAHVMMSVAAELVSEGFVLSQANTQQKFYRILPIEDNPKVMERWRRERINSAKRSVTLVNATPLAQMKDEDRKRLEKAGELAAVDLILLRHAREAFNLFERRPRARLRK